MAGKYEQFPVTLEAMRECVQDVYDLPGLRALMSDVRRRKVRVAEVATPSPSPFARSLLFGYVGMFLYETDAPLAERRAAALSLDSTLLAELLGSEAIRELLDPEVVAEVEASLQRLAPDRHARDAEGAADLLRFLGPTVHRRGGAPAGCAPEWLAELEAGAAGHPGADRRARSAGWPIEDAGRVRDALGAPLPVGVPETFTEPVPDPLGDLLLRHARTHGPFPAAEAAARFGLGVAVVSGVLDRLVGIGRLVRGELRPAALATGIRRGHRVLRRRGAAPAAAGLAGPAAGRGRAGRAARAGPVPAGVAGRAGRPPAAGAGGCGGRRAPTTCSAWSSSSPGRRCRRARWSR